MPTKGPITAGGKSIVQVKRFDPLRPDTFQHKIDPTVPTTAQDKKSQMMALGRAEVLKKKHTQDKIIKQAFKPEKGDAKKVV